MKHPDWKRSLGLLALVSALVAPGDPAAAGESPKSSPATPPPAEASATTPVPGPRSRSVGVLQAKLESIVLDEVRYDGLPLAEVVKSLMAEAAARDPEKAGVNFLFGQPVEPIRFIQAIDPNTGLPLGGNALENPDPAVVTIRIIPGLKKVRLIDALDAIVRVADRPIKYTVEGYAVIFTMDGLRINSLNNGFPLPPPTTLATRAFKVDRNTFFPSLEKMFHVRFDPDASDTGDGLRSVILPKLGVRLSRDELVIYNPLTGMLLVRASQEDLVAIQAMIEASGGNPAGGWESQAALRRDVTAPPPVRK